MSPIQQLPPEVQLEFIAEGAANIVYRIHLPSDDSPSTAADLHTLPSATSRTTPPPTEISPVGSSEQHSHLRRKLLRLRKAVPWIPSYAQLASTQEDLILPLFPSASTDLITQDLVALPPGLLADCNASLHAAEHVDFNPTAVPVAGHKPRPHKRKGLYLASDEPYGLLVTDMTADASQGEVVVEVKPKWLTQSPSAPEGSTRCRTCALRAMRAAQTPDKGSGAMFCPRDLVSRDPASVKRATDLIVAPLPDPPAASGMSKDSLTDRLAAFFASSPLLQHLCSIQKSLDPGGILALPDGKEPSTDFLVATTLRDCTLFVKMSPERGRGGCSLEARLGDLDLKAPEEGKMRYWKDTERALINEGWYQGRSDGTCRLERD